VDNVLNIHGFDLDHKLTLQPELLNPNAAPTKHDGLVTSVSLNQGAARHLRKGIQQGALDFALVKEWMDELLATRGMDLFRMKGVLNIAHAEERFIYHSVHEVFTESWEDPWGADEPRECKLVFIGKGLDAKEFAAGFNSCLATPENYARKAAALRFAVGDPIECIVDDPNAWERGWIVSQLYRDEEMPPGVLAAYEIQLENDPPGDTTYCVPDDPRVIREGAHQGAHPPLAGVSLPPAPLPFAVTCPPGTKPGDQVAVPLPGGQQVLVVIPQGVMPGGQFMVQLPAPALAPPASFASMLQPAAGASTGVGHPDQPSSKAARLSPGAQPPNPASAWEAELKRLD